MVSRTPPCNWKQFLWLFNCSTTAFGTPHKAFSFSPWSTYSLPVMVRMHKICFRAADIFVCSTDFIPCSLQKYCCILFMCYSDRSLLPGSVSIEGIVKYANHIISWDQISYLRFMLPISRPPTARVLWKTRNLDSAYGLLLTFSRHFSSSFNLNIETIRFPMRMATKFHSVVERRHQVAWFWATTICTTLKCALLKLVLLTKLAIMKCDRAEFKMPREKVNMP